MNDKRTVSTIDLALQKHDTPVGPLFVAVRHGRIKKCFTRDTAIRYRDMLDTDAENGLQLSKMGREGFNLLHDSFIEQIQKEGMPDMPVMH